jgi:hypothetical protein
MRHVKISNIAKRRLLAACVLAFACTACVASSRMESATVSEMQGVPCFSIPLSPETTNGIPLYGIVVGDPKPAAWNSRPPPLWTLSTMPPGTSINLRPQNCLRYGKLPIDSKGEMSSAQPLKPFYVYSVTLNARPPESNVSFYYAQFCVKPSRAGKTTVQIISHAEDNPDRYAVCKP